MTFAEFFFSVHDKTPFPWQQMLAEREKWPEAIDLPTASGKTACLDAAIYRLATGRSMPRRIWFVVDRRIVVDEAHERALKIASALRSEPKLKIIANALRAHGDGECPLESPLAVARLRGGTWRDDSGWSRDPRQPAIICSTVDQLGSSLLFRAYGNGTSTASIYAGLAGNDSLIILDEAHCSEPFRQTLSAIQQLRKAPWCADPIDTPFKFTIMSATLAGSDDENQKPVDVFPADDEERARALDHPLLRLRASAVKTTALRIACSKADKDDPLVKAAVEQAESYQHAGRQRIAIMVNRVNTAKAIYEQLKVSESADIVMLTGRLRLLDRDSIVEHYRPLLKSGSASALPKPIILVTTQCLEVGADFSFDALISECASLDALRQRFGRLDRLGELGTTAATILIRERDANVPEDKDDDPIYGKAIANTWIWLNEVGASKAAPVKPGSKKKAKRAAAETAEINIDFGINRLGVHVASLYENDAQRFKSLLAPQPDAPILLPAHLDLFCQTSPVPAISPDVSLFLHGKGRHAPEVRVVFRLGLDLQDKAQVQESLRLLPPTSPECLTVPLYRLCGWLADNAVPCDASGDVEGEAEPPDAWDTAKGKKHDYAQWPFILWRGKESVEITRDTTHILPNSTIVLSNDAEALYGALAALGQAKDTDVNSIDVAEQAQRLAKGRIAFRINDSILNALSITELAAPLRELIGESCDDKDDWTSALVELHAALVSRSSEDQCAPSDSWLIKTLSLIIKGFRIFTIGDPFKEVVIIANDRSPPETLDHQITDEDTGSDLEEEVRSTENAPPHKAAVELVHHTADVRRVARSFAKVLPNRWIETMDRVAHAHDWGKLDYRFQAMLHGGDETSVDSRHPLAKSAAIHAKSRHSELPVGWEHAMLSVQIAEHTGYSNDQTELHLIASHHGSARPFAALVSDLHSSAIDLTGIAFNSLTHDQRLQLTPAHDLASHTADRFWRMVRRHGWWGEAYLEAVFRLADWEASRNPSSETDVENAQLGPQPSVNGTEHSTIHLDGLDGSNPLYFLSTMGAFRLVSAKCQLAKLGWSWRNGAFRPFLVTDTPLDEEALCNLLLTSGRTMDRMLADSYLQASADSGPIQKTGKRGWLDKLCFPLHLYQKECMRRLSERNLESIAWLPALAGDCRPEWDKGTKQWLARWTRFDFTAANQAFVAMLREIKAQCTDSDLRQTLFAGPHYKAIGMSMRWDPLDEKRQYAVMDVNPAPQAQYALTDLGANFLAVEALPLFPLLADENASQACFTDAKGGLGYFQWPVWRTPITLETACSLFVSETPPPSDGRSIRKFRSNIVMPAGYFRSFTVGRPT